MGLDSGVGCVFDLRRVYFGSVHAAVHVMRGLSNYLSVHGAIELINTSTLFYYTDADDVWIFGIVIIIHIRSTYSQLFPINSTTTDFRKNTHR